VRSAELAYDLGLPLGDKVDLLLFHDRGHSRFRQFGSPFATQMHPNNNIAVYPDGYVPSAVCAILITRSRLA